jgi:hypothetical protein
MSNDYRSPLELDPEAPGLLGLLRGEGPPFGRFLAWLSVLTLFPLIIIGTVVCVGPYL